MSEIKLDTILNCVKFYKICLYLKFLSKELKNDDVVFEEIGNQEFHISLTNSINVWFYFNDRNISVIGMSDRTHLRNKGYIMTTDKFIRMFETYDFENYNELEFIMSFGREALGLFQLEEDIMILIERINKLFDNNNLMIIKRCDRSLISPLVDIKKEYPF
mgnify:CR=1 FL=1